MPQSIIQAPFNKSLSFGLFVIDVGIIIGGPLICNFKYIHKPLNNSVHETHKTIPYFHKYVPIHSVSPFEILFNNFYLRGYLSPKLSTAILLLALMFVNDFLSKNLHLLLLHIICSHPIIILLPNCNNMPYIALITNNSKAFVRFFLRHDAQTESLVCLESNPLLQRFSIFSCTSFVQF